MSTYQVRFVAGDAIRRQLDNDNIVLLSNLGFTAGGEVLNCNTYDVGLHAAVELGADKLICLHLEDVKCERGWGLVAVPWGWEVQLTGFRGLTAVYCALEGSNLGLQWCEMQLAIIYSHA